MSDLINDYRKAEPDDAARVEELSEKMIEIDRLGRIIDDYAKICKSYERDLKDAQLESRRLRGDLRAINAELRKARDSADDWRGLALSMRSLLESIAPPGWKAMKEAARS